MAHYSLFLTTLLVICWLAASPTWAKKSKDSDSDSAETQTEEAPQKVRQCQCDELDACKEDHRSQLRPCVDDCAKKLTHPDWDETAGRSCFTDRGKLKPPACFADIRKKMCAATAGVMLDVNETMTAHVKGHRGSKNNDPGETQRRAERRNSRKSYRQFMRDTFKESGNQYRRCVRACHKKVGGFGSCQKKLKCASKRLDAEQWKETRAKCSAERGERHNNFCDCLEKAGIKKPNCHVDEASHDTDHNEVN